MKRVTRYETKRGVKEEITEQNTAENIISTLSGCATCVWIMTMLYNLYEKILE